MLLLTTVFDGYQERANFTYSGIYIQMLYLNGVDRKLLTEPNERAAITLYIKYDGYYLAEKLKISILPVDVPQTRRLDSGDNAIAVIFSKFQPF